jgi:CRISPR/Cas system CSM-associated protein Csm2 small subunit
MGVIDELYDRFFKNPGDDTDMEDIEALLGQCIFNLAEAAGKDLRSNNDTSDALFAALDEIVKTPEQEAVIRQTVEDFFHDPTDDDDGEDDR